MFVCFYCLVLVWQIYVDCQLFGLQFGGQVGCFVDQVFFVGIVVDCYYDVFVCLLQLGDGVVGVVLVYVGVDLVGCLV